MLGSSPQPSAMPPLPLSHSQSGLTETPAVSSYSSVDAAVLTPTMTASTKPPHEQAARTLGPLTICTTADAVGDAAPINEVIKPLKKHHSKKKKKRNSMSELTPLIVKGGVATGKPSEEEIYPLPWFRSPEWPRRSSPLATNDKRKTGNRFRRGRSSREQTSLCNAIMSKVCCGLVAAESDVDLEIGTVARRLDRDEVESEGFKHCVQFLVGLIVVVAAVLIVMIIFQPFQQDASLW